MSRGCHSQKTTELRLRHTRGNHGKELAEGVWTTTQTVENAFSLFKRAIVGNNHKLSPCHLGPLNA